MGININQKYFLFVKLIHLSKFQLDLIQQNSLFEMIPKLFKYGYENAGRTKELLTGEPNSWNSRHWVFRRAGKECWICKTRIKSEKKLTTRPTFWCPYCQK